MLRPMVFMIDGFVLGIAWRCECDCLGVIVRKAYYDSVQPVEHKRLDWA